jgi:hypothetical protein
VSNQISAKQSIVDRLLFLMNEVLYITVSTHGMLQAINSANLSQTFAYKTASSGRDTHHPNQEAQAAHASLHEAPSI